MSNIVDSHSVAHFRNWFYQAATLSSTSESSTKRTSKTKAAKSDLSLELLTFGTQKLWKRFVLELSGARAGQTILEISSEDDSLAHKFARIVGNQGQVIHLQKSLSFGTQSSTANTSPKRSNLISMQASLLDLPFAENTFDTVTIAFNFSSSYQTIEQEMLLNALARVLKPGGRLLVLDFAKPDNPWVGKVFNQYSNKIAPLLGRLLTPDAHRYQQMQRHARHDAILNQDQRRSLMHHAGFTRCEYFNLSGGIAAVHRGYKI